MANFLDNLSRKLFWGDGWPAQASIQGALGPWVLEHEEEVHAWHRSFLEAGSQVIRTASWGSIAPRLASIGLEKRVNEINWTAARIAVDAAAENQATVLGWVGPSSLSTPEAAVPVLREQMGALLDGGCRHLLFEGFTHLEELIAAVETFRELHHCPAIILFPRNWTLEQAKPWISPLEQAGADAFGFSFSSPFSFDTAPFQGLTPEIVSFDGAPPAIKGFSKGLILGGVETSPEFIRAQIKETPNP
jgi:hypothetical protein